MKSYFTDETKTSIIIRNWKKLLNQSTKSLFATFNNYHPLRSRVHLPPSGDGRGENSAEMFGSTFIGWEEDGHNLINPDSRVQFDCVNPLRRAKVIEETRFSRKRKLEASSIDSPRMTMVVHEGASLYRGCTKRELGTMETSFLESRPCFLCPTFQPIFVHPFPFPVDVWSDDPNKSFSPRWNWNQSDYTSLLCKSFILLLLLSLFILKPPRQPSIILVSLSL